MNTPSDVATMHAQAPTAWARLLREPRASFRQERAHFEGMFPASTSTALAQAYLPDLRRRRDEAASAVEEARRVLSAAEDRLADVSFCLEERTFATQVS